MLTEIIDLPSEGKMYPIGHPLASGQIEIKYMTAKEEDILTTDSYVQKNIVLNKLLESVIVTKDINVDDLCIGDKQYLLLNTRILGYGSQYSFTYNDKTHTVNLSDLKIKGRPDFFDNSPLISFELPRAKKNVTLKALNSGESAKISDEIRELKKKGIPVGEVTYRLRHMIVDIDGNSDASTIQNFVSNELLAADSLGIRLFLDSVLPDVDFTIDIDGEEVEIPIGIDFFYPAT